MPPPSISAGTLGAYADVHRSLQDYLRIKGTLAADHPTAFVSKTSRKVDQVEASLHDFDQRRATAEAVAADPPKGTPDGDLLEDFSAAVATWIEAHRRLEADFNTCNKGVSPAPAECLDAALSDNVTSIEDSINRLAPLEEALQEKSE